MSISFTYHKTPGVGFEPTRAEPSGLAGCENLFRGNRKPLKEIYQQHKNEFIKYLERKVSEKTLNAYISAIEKHLPKNITQPRELREQINFEKRSKYISLALRNLLNFLEEEYFVDSINGYSIAQWKKHIPIKKSGVTEIYLSDDEVREGYERVHEDFKTFYKLLVYSGGRFQHVFSALETLNQQNIVVIEKLGIARYPIIGISTKQKKGFWLYFPADFVDELVSYKSQSFDWTLDNLTISKRVRPKAIRKWHYNKMIECGIDASIADFIQGRSPASVGAMHYLATARQSDNAYSKVVDEIRKVIE